MEATPPTGTPQTDTPSVPTTEAPAPAQPEAPADVQPNVDNVPDKEQVQPGQPSARAQETGERDEWYCPGCGRGFLIPIECTGRPDAPHPPIQTVETAELDGDPSEHTAAPATE